MDMNTMTKTERPPTFKDVERAEKSLADIRQKLADYREVERDLGPRIATALADGEDVSALQAERRDAQTMIRDLEAVEPELEARIEELRHGALQEMARQRLRTIRKKLGGLVGEAPRRAEKARELLDALSDQLEWLVSLNTRHRLFREEAAWLAARFDLEAPELRTFDVNGVKVAIAARRRLKRIREPRDSLIVGKSGAALAQTHAEMYGEETPPELMESAMERPDG